MESNWFKHISFAGLIIFFQITVFNNLDISSSVIPCIYPVIIISFNRVSNRSLLLITGFLLGLLIDIFSNTGGAHAMATTLLAFFQPYLLSSMGPSDSNSDKIKPSIYSLGLKNYLVFLLILLFVHHIIVFFIEVFSFSNFGFTLFRIASSTCASLVLITILQFIFVRKEK
jgi:rod shape-determining protein MreD